MTYGPATDSLEEERILTIVGNLLRTGGFMGMRGKRYSLVVTDRRLIFAELTKDKLKEILQQAKGEAQRADKGRMGQWGAQIRASRDYHKRYRDMPPDTVLTETPGNFAIDRTAVKKLKIKKTAQSYNNPEFDVVDSGKVIIKTSSEKIVLRVMDGLPSVKDELRKAGLCR